MASLSIPLPACVQKRSRRIVHSSVQWTGSVAVRGHQGCADVFAGHEPWLASRVEDRKIAALGGRVRAAIFPVRGRGEIQDGRRSHRWKQASRLILRLPKLTPPQLVPRRSRQRLDRHADPRSNEPGEQRSGHLYAAQPSSHAEWTDSERTGCDSDGQQAQVPPGV